MFKQIQMRIITFFQVILMAMIMRFIRQVVKVGQKSAHFIMGDFPDFLNGMKISEMAARAARAPNGIFALRLGPPFGGIHLYFIQPSAEAKIAVIQLRTVMDLAEPEARSFYGQFAAVTRSSFFISENNDHALLLRQRYVQGLDKRKIFKQAEALFPQLRHQLTENKNDPNTDHFSTIANHLQAVISRALYGFELTPTMAACLHQARKTTRSGLLPISLLSLMPRFRAMRAEFDVQIERFLHHFIKTISSEMDMQAAIASKNPIVDIIVRRFPHLKTLKDLDEAGIHALIHFPEMRVTVSGLTAIDNLSQALKWGLYHLFENGRKELPRTGWLQKMLCEEIESLGAESDSLDMAVLLDKDRMPILHAIYLESLRYGSIAEKDALPVIPRFTRKGFQLNEVPIPPRTLIFFNLTAMLNQCADQQYRADLFIPLRFLTPNNQLNEKAKVNQDYMTPFGLGKRACPAAAVVEVLMKFHLVQFVKTFRNFSKSGLDWNKDFSPVAEDRPLSPSVHPSTVASSLFSAAKPRESAANPKLVSSSALRR